MINTYCSSINDMIAAIDHKRAIQINWRPFLNFSSHESRRKKTGRCREIILAVEDMR